MLFNTYQAADNASMDAAELAEAKENSKPDSTSYSVALAVTNAASNAHPFHEIKPGNEACLLKVCMSLYFELLPAYSPFYLLF